MIAGGVGNIEVLCATEAEDTPILCSVSAGAVHDEEEVYHDHIHPPCVLFSHPNGQLKTHGHGEGNG